MVPCYVCAAAANHGDTTEIAGGTTFGGQGNHKREWTDNFAKMNHKAQSPSTDRNNTNKKDPIPKACNRSDNCDDGEEREHPCVDDDQGPPERCQLMGRPRRANLGGLIYHVLNRDNAGMTIFEQVGDYEAFEHILQEAAYRTGMRILAYCIMPNHWHMVLWPTEDGQLSRFAGWVTLTHSQRWHAYRHNAGSGHVYQGCFKSFPMQDDAHFTTVCCYVERNALRANLVKRAQDWRWCSLHRWKYAAPK